MRRELEILIADRAFETRFQPVVDPRTRRAFAHEAFSRAARGSALLARPAELFAAAQRFDLSRPLDQACLELAIRRFHEAALLGRLLLNVYPGTLLIWSGFGDWLASTLKGARLEPSRVVLALTGQLPLADVAALREAVRRLREQGFALGVDRLGAGASGLLALAALRPDYVKIDTQFPGDGASGAVRTECLRATIDAARALGGRIIVEGVESAAECERLLELGVDYLQGRFLGAAAGRPALTASAGAWLAERGRPKSATLVESVLLEVEPIDPDALVIQAVKRFFADKMLAALPVVAAGKPVGMVWRDELFGAVVASALEAGHAPRVVRDVMDDNPPLLDVATRLELAARYLSEPTGARPRAGFLIVDPDGYRGVGSTSDVLRRVVAQHEQAASLEHPVTKLPGRRPLRGELARLGSARGGGVLCHLDIDHFKSFNDRYGHERGDQVLVSLAEALTRHADADVDFIAHAGSDDFVLVLRSRDWRERLTRVLRDFAALVPSFYDGADRDQGSILLAERTGEWRRAPFMSLSVAAIDTVGYAPELSSPQATALMQRLEALAKAHPGNAFFLALGGHLFDLSAEFEPHAAHVARPAHEPAMRGEADSGAFALDAAFRGELRETGTELLERI